MFYTKTWWNIQVYENFNFISIINSSNLGFKSKRRFLQFLVGPYLFCGPNPDPGSQNVTYPRSLDPKHCVFVYLIYSVVCTNNTKVSNNSRREVQILPRSNIQVIIFTLWGKMIFFNPFSNFCSNISANKTNIL